MHQLSIIRQSERVKGDWWMSSPISRAHPAYLRSSTSTPHLWSSKPACLSDKQHRTCRTSSVKRWGQDGGDKGQLLMNRQIWWFQSISLHGIIYCWVRIVKPNWSEMERLDEWMKRFQINYLWLWFNYDCWKGRLLLNTYLISQPMVQYFADLQQKGKKSND